MVIKTVPLMIRSNSWMRQSHLHFTTTASSLQTEHFFKVILSLKCLLKSGNGVTYVTVYKVVLSVTTLVPHNSLRQPSPLRKMVPLISSYRWKKGEVTSSSWYRATGTTGAQNSQYLQQCSFYSNLTTHL